MHVHTPPGSDTPDGTDSGRGPHALRDGRRVISALLLLASLLTFGSLVAQQGWGRNGFRGLPPQRGLPQRNGGVDRGFTFCRLYYNAVRREAGGQTWSTDWPNAEANFTLRLSQLTAASVSRWDNGQTGYATVAATDATLYECPFLFASDVGTAGFSAEEAEQLRNYLLKGGFLWADDFWGSYAWQHWESQIQRILPGYAIVDMPLDHRLFSFFFLVRRIPQIPSIQHWRRSGGGTSERGGDSAEPHLRGIFDERGRLMVLLSHNTDIADGWEREGEDPDFFYAFSPEAYGLGVNIALWILTH